MADRIGRRVAANPRQRAVLPAGRARDRRGDWRQRRRRARARCRTGAAARLARRGRAGCARSHLSPSASARIIVATNIAETSLTVNGVSAVIDSGLQKVARYDAERGVDSLDDRAHHARQRRSARRPGRAARSRHRPPPVGPARSTAAASRGGDPSRRSVRAAAVDPGVGRSARHVRVVRSAARRAHRLGDVAAHTPWRDRGRSRHGARAAAAAHAAASPARARAASTAAARSRAARRARGCPSRAPEGSAAATTCDLLPIIDRWNEMPPHLSRSPTADSIAEALGAAYRDHIERDQLRRPVGGLPGSRRQAARRRQGDAGDRSWRRDRTGERRAQRRVVHRA